MLLHYYFGNLDQSVPGDYDDDKDDTAVYRNGVWYIKRSTSGLTAVNFGTSTEIPTKSKYDP